MPHFRVSLQQQPGRAAGLSSWPDMHPGNTATISLFCLIPRFRVCSSSPCQPLRGQIGELLLLPYAAGGAAVAQAASRLRWRPGTSLEETAAAVGLRPSLVLRPDGFTMQGSPVQLPSFLAGGGDGRDHTSGTSRDAGGGGGDVQLPSFLSGDGGGRDHTSGTSRSGAGDTPVQLPSFLGGGGGGRDHTSGTSRSGDASGVGGGSSRQTPEVLVGALLDPPDRDHTSGTSQSGDASGAGGGGRAGRQTPEINPRDEGGRQTPEVLVGAPLDPTDALACVGGVRAILSLVTVCALPPHQRQPRWTHPGVSLTDE